MHVVAERPGIGGTEWNGAIEEHEAFLVKKFAADASGLKKALKKVEESLSKWVVVPRFDAANRGSGQRISGDLRGHGALGDGSSSECNLAGRDGEQYAQLASQAE